MSDVYSFLATEERRGESSRTKKNELERRSFCYLYVFTVLVAMRGELSWAVGVLLA